MTMGLPLPDVGDTPVIPLFGDGRDGSRGRIFIVEDHELLAQILVHALQGAGFHAAFSGGPDPETILATASRFSPTLVFLDVDLGDAGSGVELIPGLTALEAPVVMLTGSTDRLTFAECVEAGARGLLNKDASFDELLGAIETVGTEGTLITEATRHDLLAELRRTRSEDRERRRPYERLTPRERQVLARLADGMSATEIASVSFVSVATVRSQIRAILVKLGVTSQLAAVAMATKMEWIHQ